MIKTDNLAEMQEQGGPGLPSDDNTQSETEFSHEIFLNKKKQDMMRLFEQNIQKTLKTLNSYNYNQESGDEEERDSDLNEDEHEQSRGVEYFQNRENERNGFSDYRLQAQIGFSSGGQGAGAGVGDPGVSLGSAGKESQNVKISDIIKNGGFSSGLGRIGAGGSTRQNKKIDINKQWEYQSDGSGEEEAEDKDEEAKAENSRLAGVGAGSVIDTLKEKKKGTSLIQTLGYRFDSEAMNHEDSDSRLDSGGGRDGAGRFGVGGGSSAATTNLPSEPVGIRSNITDLYNDLNKKYGFDKTGSSRSESEANGSAIKTSARKQLPSERENQLSGFQSGQPKKFHINEKIEENGDDLKENEDYNLGEDSDDELDLEKLKEITKKKFGFNFRFDDLSADDDDDEDEKNTPGLQRDAPRQFGPPDAQKNSSIQKFSGYKNRLENDFKEQDFNSKALNSSSKSRGVDLEGSEFDKNLAAQIKRLKRETDIIMQEDSQEESLDNSDPSIGRQGFKMNGRDKNLANFNGREVNNDPKKFSDLKNKHFGSDPNEALKNEKFSNLLANRFQESQESALESTSNQELFKNQLLSQKTKDLTKRAENGGDEAESSALVTSSRGNTQRVADSKPSTLRDELDEKFKRFDEFKQRFNTGEFQDESFVKETSEDSDLDDFRKNISSYRKNDFGEKFGGLGDHTGVKGYQESREEPAEPAVHDLNRFKIDNEISQKFDLMLRSRNNSARKEASESDNEHHDDSTEHAAGHNWSKIVEPEKKQFRKNFDFGNQFHTKTAEKIPQANPISFKDTFQKKDYTENLQRPKSRPGTAMAQNTPKTLKTTTEGPKDDNNTNSLKFDIQKSAKLRDKLYSSTRLKQENDILKRKLHDIEEKSRRDREMIRDQHESILQTHIERHQSSLENVTKQYEREVDHLRSELAEARALIDSLRSEEASLIKKNKELLLSKKAQDLKEKELREQIKREKEKKKKIPRTDNKVVQVSLIKLSQQKEANMNGSKSDESQNPKNQTSLEKNFLKLKELYDTLYKANVTLMQDQKDLEGKYSKLLKAYNKQNQKTLKKSTTSSKRYGSKRTQGAPQNLKRRSNSRKRSNNRSQTSLKNESSTKASLRGSNRRKTSKSKKKAKNGSKKFNDDSGLGVTTSLSRIDDTLGSYLCKTANEDSVNPHQMSRVLNESSFSTKKDESLFTNPLIQKSVKMRKKKRRSNSNASKSGSKHVTTQVLRFLYTLFVFRGFSLLFHFIFFLIFLNFLKILKILTVFLGSNKG